MYQQLYHGDITITSMVEEMPVFNSVE